MKLNDVAIFEMLSLIYEEMDVDSIEERFVDLVSEAFSFDRVGLFFIKHKKGVLQGKLCKGFEPGTISSLEIPVEEKYLFTRPLISGFPLWDVVAENDFHARKMGLNNFALVPIVNKKRVPCWKVKGCEARDCPAFGKRWLRCWLVPDTKCNDGSVPTFEDKMKNCRACPVFASQNIDTVEGVMLVDNSISNKPIDSDMITVLSIIAHAVGVAINNSKVYTKTLKVAIKDELTGLHNRRYFNERLLDELERAKRYSVDVTLLLADIDHFKQVNDTHGHPEFALLLLNTTKQKAVEIAEGLRTVIEKTSEKETNGIKISASFGVAAFGEDANSFEGLISKADKALYFAKAQGRNRVCTV
jgi:GGDEF domain-containing protein